MYVPYVPRNFPFGPFIEIAPEFAQCIYSFIKKAIAIQQVRRLNPVPAAGVPRRRGLTGIKELVTPDRESAEQTMDLR